MRSRRFGVLLLLPLTLVAGRSAAGFTALPYDIGNPTLQDIWVDPVNGNDASSGASRAQAVRTVSEAWNRIPMATPLSTGYRIQLVAATYAVSDVPNYWEQRHGTFAFPVIINAADGAGTALMPSMNIFDCRYIYLIGLRIDAPGGDVLHCDTCVNFLLRQTTVRGQPPATQNVQEALKVNQSTNVFVEECDISGAWDNAIDFVAVQGGHILASKIHDSGDWGMYNKGGSAYIRVEGNEIYDCGTGGFTAGQGTGFEFMVDPYLHYEAYDIKFVNNVIHDTAGAAFGVNGGYMILMAYNTAYRVGARSHVIEVVFGQRSCDGNSAQCAQYLSRGGWGTSQIGPYEPIPDRHVYVFNNIVYNPPGFQSQWQQFAIYGPLTPSPGTNIPDPALTDDDLRIRGNIIWNGPPSMPIGIEDPSAGCQPGNPTCNLAQILADNAINTVEPELVNPGGGDFHPVAAGNVYSVATYAIPDFPGSDWPQPPSPPPANQGDLTNDVPFDRDGNVRTSTAPPGAYIGGGGTGGPQPCLAIGAGADPSAPPTISVFRLNGTVVSSFGAYGSTGFGANVAACELDRDAQGYGEMLTGPGPGAVYGPQIHAFQEAGLPFPKVNFFAYGTLRFGANVAGADLDADGFDEILTGPGPGAVFGPHVRGFNFDNASVTAIAKISFFAYGTLKFGVIPAGGEVDGDGFHEILTGPGPGAAFSAQLRGFDYDGAAVTAITKINANVLDPSARHGLNPAAGNVDNDGYDEIGVGSGPDPAHGGDFQLLDYDGAALSSITLQTIYAGAGGVRAILGEMDGDAFDEIGTAAGAPVSGAQIRGFGWDATAWTPMAAPSFDAFPAYGAKLGGSTLVAP
ncbi:MAG: right-handed parallel beta-helix repeat-containing protein [Acidobacteriota bacterium]